MTLGIFRLTFTIIFSKRRKRYQMYSIEKISMNRFLELNPLGKLKINGKSIKMNVCFCYNIFISNMLMHINNLLFIKQTSSFGVGILQQMPY